MDIISECLEEGKDQIPRKTPWVKHIKLFPKYQCKECYRDSIL